MIAPFVGIAFAKSKNGTVIPDLKEVFSSKNDLQEYLKEFTKSENKVSEGVELSRRFLSSFQNFISNCEAQKLGRAFESKPKRTSFYRDLAMPAIAKDLGLVVSHIEAKR